MEQPIGTKEWLSEKLSLIDAQDRDKLEKNLTTDDFNISKRRGSRRLRLTPLLQCIS